MFGQIEQNRPGGRPSKWTGWAGGVAGVVATIALVACTIAEPTQAQQSDEALRAQVDEIVTSAMEAGYYPGIAVSISRNGETVYAQGYGTANIEYDYPVSAETVFPIGSVTKSFTSLAVAQLAAAGELSLDDSIAEYIDDLPEGWDVIRVRNLMDHTSGIYNYTNDRRIHECQDCNLDNAEMRAFFETHPLSFAPGEQFNYTNSGFYFLGMIIERVSGQSYGEYLQEHIFGPFGMEHSSIADFTRIIPGRAAGYHITADGYVNAGEFSPSIPFSAGTIISTVGDLERYADAVHESDLVSDEVRDIIYTQDDLGDGEPSQYALGALILQSVNGHRKISHSGDIFGFASHFAHYPDENVTISVLTNNQQGAVHPSSIERKLARVVFGETQPEIIDQELTDAEVDAFAGDYNTYPVTFVTPEAALYVGDDGHMNFTFGSAENPIFGFPLLYQGGGRFVAAMDSEITVTVDTTASPASQLEVVMFDGRFVANRVTE